MMAASTASKGFGSQLGYGATPTKVGQVRDVSLGGIEWDSIDITSLDSDDGFREFIAGLADAGDIEFDLIFKKTVFTTLYTKGGVSDSWTWTFSDGSKLVFNGFISSFGIEVPFEEEISQKIKIKISGKPVFTAGA